MNAYVFFIKGYVLDQGVSDPDLVGSDQSAKARPQSENACDQSMNARLLYESGQSGGFSTTDWRMASIKKVEMCTHIVGIPFGVGHFFEENRAIWAGVIGEGRSWVFWLENRGFLAETAAFS